MAQTQQTLKAGTRIETHGMPALGGFPGVAPERATVQRWTKANGPIKNHVNPTAGGWHIIKYESGGCLCVHESGFRVIDNGAPR